MLTLVAVHATGVVGDVLFPVVVLAAVVAGAVGRRRRRSIERGPRFLMLGAGVLWTVAAIVREMDDPVGNLGRSRPLLSDAFAVPGYVLLAVALIAMVRDRRTRVERAVLIDAALVAVGSAAMVFSFVVEPAMRIDGAWLPARLAIAVYPAFSIWLLIAVVQLTLTRPRRRSGQGFLIAGVAFLTIGDVVAALGEIGTIGLPVHVLDVPYLSAAAFFGASLLHPGVQEHVRAGPLDAAVCNPMRMFAIAVAIVAPIVVMATNVDLVGEGSVELTLLTVTALLTIARIVYAAHSEKAAQEDLLVRATHDRLTGLASRELLLEQATLLLEESGEGSVGLLLLDLDEFKLVNDSLGHDAGDQLLIEVGRRLSGSVRRDDVVGRIGGDEFVVVAPGLDESGAHALCDRIRRSMRAPFRLGSEDRFVSVSVGVTIAGPSTTASVLMQEGDTAMYRSKDDGRNRVTFFDPTMRTRVERRVELEQGLRNALGRNEVSVAFQPIVDISRQRVEGVEALMRWSTATTSYSPAEFMDVAEDSGLIIPLGEFVLDESCRQLARWRRDVPGCEQLTVSVNLSGRQVQNSDLVAVVAAALNEHGLPGDALWLEITESIMLDDMAATIEVMHGLRRLGVRLAVDDFGTGFSSLAYLRAFPVSRVKIDRSFVTELSADAASSALVKAVLAIGESMDLDVVAEGVESDRQAQCLADLGCRRIQGFLFARPAPSVEIPALIASIEGDGADRPGSARRSAGPVDHHTLV